MKLEDISRLLAELLEDENSSGCAITFTGQRSAADAKIRKVMNAEYPSKFSVHVSPTAPETELWIVKK